MVPAVAYRRALLPLILLLLAACGGSAPAVTSVVLPAGWQTVRQAGVSLALPPEWEVLAAEDGNFESALDELVQENPRLQGVVGQASAAISGGQIMLLAFDLAPEDALPNFTTNLSIGLQQLPQPVSLEAVAKANEEQLRTSGFGDVRRSTTRVGGEEVARLASALQINDAAGSPLSLALEQFVVVRAQQQYVLTFTTAAEHKQKMAPVFEQIMATLRIEE